MMAVKGTVGTFLTFIRVASNKGQGEKKVGRKRGILLRWRDLADSGGLSWLS